MNTRKKLEKGDFLQIKITFLGKENYCVETKTNSGIVYKGKLKKLDISRRQ